MDEAAACTPVPVNPNGFNPDVNLPYGLTAEQVRKAMESFTDFLGYINHALHTNGLDRIESMLMAANFSSIVGEFVGAAIPRFCPQLIRNAFPNGHPDLIPIGIYENNNIKVANEGIEVKGSQRAYGWQGHNPEDTWLMVFVFDSNKPAHKLAGIGPKAFQFRSVLGAKIEKSDWSFSGRSDTSRRTITATVKPSGRDKMLANWIYRDPPT